MVRRAVVQTMNIPFEDIDLIAEELAPAFLGGGRTLQELRRNFRELPTQSEEFACVAKQLHDLFALAAAERFKRMGLEVQPGNARLRMREPGEDDL